MVERMTANRPMYCTHTVYTCTGIRLVKSAPDRTRSYLYPPYPCLLEPPYPLVPLDPLSPCVSRDTERDHGKAAVTTIAMYLTYHDSAGLRWAVLFKHTTNIDWGHFTRRLSRQGFRDPSTIGRGSVTAQL